MTTNSTGDQYSGRFKLVQSVKTPLAFFVLFVLIVESLMAILVARASDFDRTIAIIGMLVLLFGAGAAVFVLAYRQSTSPSSRPIERAGLESLTFDQVAAEISSTLDRLEQDSDLVAHYRDQGDFSRLLDGLYSGLLYASSGVPTGQIDPIFYGNLMEWDEEREALRVRYFKGPYNDEIITRAFPLKGPKQGVASAAVESGQIQIRNSMESELKERGEGRLRALMCVPVPRLHGEGLEDGAIVVISIDSVDENVFPQAGSSQLEPIQKRARELAAYVQRVNRLQKVAVQKA